MMVIAIEYLRTSFLFSVFDESHRYPWAGEIHIFYSFSSRLTMEMTNKP